MGTQRLEEGWTLTTPWVAVIRSYQAGLFMRNDLGRSHAVEGRLP